MRLVVSSFVYRSSSSFSQSVSQSDSQSVSQLRILVRILNPYVPSFFVCLLVVRMVVRAVQSPAFQPTRAHRVGARVRPPQDSPRDLRGGALAARAAAADLVLPPELTKFPP